MPGVNIDIDFSDDNGLTWIPGGSNPEFCTDIVLGKDDWLKNPSQQVAIKMRCTPVYDIAAYNWTIEFQPADDPFSNIPNVISSDPLVKTKDLFLNDAIPPVSVHPTTNEAEPSIFPRAFGKYEFRCEVTLASSGAKVYAHRSFVIRDPIDYSINIAKYEGNEWSAGSGWTYPANYAHFKTKKPYHQDIITCFKAIDAVALRFFNAAPGQKLPKVVDIGETIKNPDAPGVWIGTNPRTLPKLRGYSKGGNTGFEAETVMCGVLLNEPWREYGLSGYDSTPVQTDTFSTASRIKPAIVLIRGLQTGLDTSGAAVVGAPVYLDTVDGDISFAPGTKKVLVGYVAKINDTDGSIFFDFTNCVWLQKTGLESLENNFMVTMGDGVHSLGRFNSSDYPDANSCLTAALASLPAGGYIFVGPGDYVAQNEVDVDKSVTIKFLGGATWHLGDTGSFHAFNLKTNGIRIENARFDEGTAYAPVLSKLLFNLDDGVQGITLSGVSGKARGHIVFGHSSMGNGGAVGVIVEDINSDDGFGNLCTLPGSSGHFWRDVIIRNVTAIFVNNAFPVLYASWVDGLALDDFYIGMNQQFIILRDTIIGFSARNGIISSYSTIAVSGINWIDILTTNLPAPLPIYNISFENILADINQDSSGNLDSLISVIGDATNFIKGFKVHNFSANLNGQYLNKKVLDWQCIEGVDVDQMDWSVIDTPNNDLLKGLYIYLCAGNIRNCTWYIDTDAGPVNTAFEIIEKASAGLLGVGSGNLYLENNYFAFGDFDSGNLGYTQIGAKIEGCYLDSKLLTRTSGMNIDSTNIEEITYIEDGNTTFTNCVFGDTSGVSIGVGINNDVNDVEIKDSLVNGEVRISGDAKLSNLFTLSNSICIGHIKNAFGNESTADDSRFERNFITGSLYLGFGSPAVSDVDSNRSQIVGNVIIGNIFLAYSDQKTSITDADDCHIERNYVTQNVYIGYGDGSHAVGCVVYGNHLAGTIYSAKGDKPVGGVSCDASYLICENNYALLIEIAAGEDSIGNHSTVIANKLSDNTTNVIVIASGANSVAEYCHVNDNSALVGTATVILIGAASTTSADYTTVQGNINFTNIYSWGTIAAGGGAAYCNIIGNIVDNDAKFSTVANDSFDISGGAAIIANNTEY